MQSIVEQFAEGRYRSTQVWRDGDLAMYLQQHKESRVQRYEVIRIRIQHEHTWPNGTVTPEKEAYPSSTAWGKYGWTFHTLQAAQDHLATLQVLGDATDDRVPCPADNERAMHDHD